MDYQLHSTDIKVDGHIMTAHLTLSTLHVGLPIFGMQDDCNVYFLAKIDYRKSKHTARTMFVVDMKTKTISQVEFCIKRTLGLAKGYDASSISAHLKA